MVLSICSNCSCFSICPSGHDHRRSLRSSRRGPQSGHPSLHPPLQHFVPPDAFRSEPQADLQSKELHPDDLCVCVGVCVWLYTHPPPPHTPSVNIRYFLLIKLPGPFVTCLQAILDGFLGEFPEEVKNCSTQIVNAAVDIYNRLSLDLLPTPAKSHYVFNLRDLSKCVQGGSIMLQHLNSNSGSKSI